MGKRICSVPLASIATELPGPELVPESRRIFSEKSLSEYASAWASAVAKTCREAGSAGSKSLSESTKYVEAACEALKALENIASSHKKI
ncbi:MAG: hypothetical protein A49_05600 [Methyloceanibacter sp.]|nr:MAG: hypothetical protein A49_05600 [Methyloceanibacter sp.]